MKNNNLTERDKEILLQVARAAITAAVSALPLPVIDVAEQPELLQEKGASFVTLTAEGRLRGCIGTMEAHQPLIMDVQEHAVAAAMSDYRFSPVRPEELAGIRVEISRLTPLSALPYLGADQLLAELRIGVDGVLLSAGSRRATFLPQVWEQLSRPEEFLSQLCLKMGAATDYWKTHPMDVFTYQVEKFGEE
jgi:AmmeMemoRadiSam system protein A